MDRGIEILRLSGGPSMSRFLPTVESPDFGWTRSRHGRSPA
jgi:hypothetical protein